MSITAKRITQDVVITGASQSETTESIMGRIDQLIIVASATRIFNLILTNDQDQEIYRAEGLNVDTTLHTLRPNILPMGTVTITIENPSTASGTVIVVIIEKERES